MTTTAEKIIRLLSGSVWNMKKNADGVLSKRPTSQNIRARESDDVERENSLGRKTMMDSWGELRTQRDPIMRWHGIFPFHFVKALPKMMIGELCAPFGFMTCDNRRRIITQSPTGDATAASVCDKIHVHEAICIQF